MKIGVLLCKMSVDGRAEDLCPDRFGLNVHHVTQAWPGSGFCSGLRDKMSFD